MPKTPFDRIERLDLKLNGPSEAGNTVPAELLAQALTHMQRAIYLYAMYREEHPVNERARIPGDIEARYLLRCEIPRTGSYAMPATVGQPWSDFFDPERIGATIAGLRDVLDAAARGAVQQLRNLLPEHAMRARVIREIREMIPKRNTGWSLTVESPGARGAKLTSEILPALEQAESADAGERVHSIVRGRLQRIDFKNHKFALHYAPSGRELECPYPVAQEELLLANHRRLIEVTGMIDLDEEGLATKIIEVEGIATMDLSPIRVTEVRRNDRILRPIHAIELIPEPDESEQLITLRHPELGIDLFVDTHAELESALQDQIDFLWHTYALGDRSRMTRGAAELADRLRHAFREVRNAA